jgi:hypothetical protein
MSGHDAGRMNLSPAVAPLSSSALRVVALDPANAYAGGGPVHRMMREFPLPVDFRVIHVMPSAQGVVAGAAALGTTSVEGSQVLLGAWPIVGPSMAECGSGGLRPWEMLLRSQLWWALQRDTPVVLLAAPAAAVRPVFAYLGDVGAHAVRPGALPSLLLPPDWALVRVSVERGLDGLRAKRLANAFLARYTGAAGRARSAPSR